VNKKNLLVDLGIFAVFLGVMNPALTGLVLHEWISIALAAAVVAHLVLHWKWIISVGSKYFGNLWHSSRLKLFLDILLFLDFTAVMTSGILISQHVIRLFGIQLVENNIWIFAHSLSANLSLLLIAVHIGLNWRWVVGMVGRYILTPAAHLFHRQPQPVAETIRISSDK
jgi:hypothetical protein